MSIHRHISSLATFEYKRYSNISFRLVYHVLWLWNARIIVGVGFGRCRATHRVSVTRRDRRASATEIGAPR